MDQKLTGLMKWLPFVALVYAIYEAYGKRGVGGFLEDLKALPGIIENEAARNQLLTGVAILLVGSYIVMRFAPRGWVKYITLGGIYFFATQQIAMAIKSGAGRSGGTYLRQGPAMQRRVM